MRVPLSCRFARCRFGCGREGDCGSGGVGIHRGGGGSLLCSIDSGGRELLSGDRLLPLYSLL